MLKLYSRKNKYKFLLFYACLLNIFFYICTNKQTKTNIMKTVKTPTIENTKKIMNLLLECVKDKNISIQERNQYYSEYLQLAQNLIKLSK